MTVGRPFRSYAVVPAAGQSLRMGRPKLLLPWGSRTVIECTLQAWRQGNVTRVVVIVRPGDSELAAVVQAAGAEVVVPASPPPEMKDSIRAALEWIMLHERPDERDAWLLAPADMPHLSAAVIEQLLAEHDPHDPKIRVPVHGGSKGHPVLFPWSTASAVATLPADAGVNELLNRHAWIPVPVGDSAIHGDLDTPEDYRRSRAR